MNYIFLHGLAGEPENWFQTTDYLRATGAKCFTPKIEYLKQGYNSLDELAQAIQIPSGINPDDTVVIGNSLGAVLAILMQEYASRIVLVAPPLLGETRKISMGGTSFSKEIAKLFYDPNKITSEQLERYRSMWKKFISSRANISKLRKIKKMSSSFDYDSNYKRFQSKITLICGREDNTSPLSHFEEVVKKYPQIALKVIEDCGHAVPLERPKELADLLIQEK